MIENSIAPQAMFAHCVDGVFCHVFPSECQVRLCGDDPIIPVVVTADGDGEHWGWYDGDCVSMIWPTFIQLSMCFPYGIKAAENCGQGVRVRLSIRGINND